MQLFNSVILPDNQSIAEYLEDHTPKKLLSLIDASTGSAAENAENKSNKRMQVKEELGEITFKRNDINYRIRGFNKDGFEKIVQIVFEIDDKIFPDKIDLSRHQGRIKFANSVALEYEISPEYIKQDLNFIYSHLDKLQDDSFKEKAGLNKKEVHLITKTRENKAKDLLCKRDLLNEMLIKDTERIGHVGEDINKKLYYLSAVSRLTKKPLSVLVVASSGSGKSYCLETVVDLFRQGHLTKCSRITPQAFYYSSEEELKDKAYYIEELVGVEEAFESIRMLLSSGYLAVRLPEKDPRTGSMRTVERRVKADIPILSSATKNFNDEETMSRFIITHNDESLEQKMKILKAQAEKYSLEGSKANLYSEKIIEKYRDFDYVFDTSLKVVNPYTKKIMLNPNLHIVARKQEQYLRLMYNTAFIRQHSKEVKKAGDRYGNTFNYVEVDRSDVETANEIAGQIFHYDRGDLTKRLTESYRIIEKYCTEAIKNKKINLYEYKFSRREIREHTVWGLTKTKEILDELARLEYLVPIKGSQGKQFTYRLAPYGNTINALKDLQLLDPSKL